MQDQNTGQWKREYITKPRRIEAGKKPDKKAKKEKKAETPEEK